MPRAKPKGTLATVCIVYVLFFAALACGRQDSSTAEKGDEPLSSQESSTADEGEEPTDAQGKEGKGGEDHSSTYYYYYEGERIFLQQITDKILLKFAPDASKEQLQILIGSDASLKSTSDTYLEGGSLRIAVLESKDGKQIPSATIEFFKAKPEVLSAEYLYQYNGGKLQGIMNEFVVKLKESTSYDQLKKLAEQNNCIVGEENQFVKNQYLLYVSKLSDLNAMQMSNLFYETGLFEFSEPNNITFNAFDV